MVYIGNNCLVSAKFLLTGVLIKGPPSGLPVSEHGPRTAGTCRINCTFTTKGHWEGHHGIQKSVCRVLATEVKRKRFLFPLLQQHSSTSTDFGIAFFPGFVNPIYWLEESLFSRGSSHLDNDQGVLTSQQTFQESIFFKLYFLRHFILDRSSKKAPWH